MYSVLLAWIAATTCSALNPYPDCPVDFWSVQQWEPGGYWVELTQTEIAEYQVNMLTTGTYKFRVVGNGIGDPSNEVTVTIPAKIAPNSPGQFGVQ